MKKVIAMLLAIIMMVSLCACSNTSETTSKTNDAATTKGTDSSDAGNTADINDDELPNFRIAFCYSNYTDRLGLQFKNCIEYLSKAYNCEPVFFEMGRGDTAISNLETVLTAGGIDGVVSVGIDSARIEVAKKYDVPVITVCAFPETEEDIKGVSDYDKFLGGVIDDESWAGTRCIEALYEAGCRNICYSGLKPGITKASDDRANGMREVVEANADLNLLADSYTVQDFAGDIATFTASFSEMDGIGFSSVSDGLYLSLEAEGIADGSVKIAGIDVSSQTGTYFENGVQVWTCGGQYATAMVGWAIMYNYLLDGTRIIEDTKEPIVRKYIEITSYEDYEQYIKYVEDDSLPSYDAEEIKNMIHYFNEDVTLQDYLDDANSYSLEDVIARHGDAIDAR